MDKHYLKRPARNLSGLWLALASLLIVGGWYLLVIVYNQAPPHWRAMAAELGSLPQFKQDLSPNSTGTRLVYCQATEKGVGIYFCETENGKSKLLCEQKEKGYSWQRFSMLGWSPDDKLFACAVPLSPRINAGQQEEQILVCDGLSGDPVAKISADPNLYELAWLSPHSFVSSTDYNYDLRLFEQNPDGKWVVRQISQKVAQSRLENLTAISGKSVAWQDRGNICTFDFASSVAKKIWEADTNQYQLVDFTYSKETGEFLLNCSDEKGQFLVRFSPGSKETTDAGRIGSPQDFISIVKGINGKPEGWIGAWKRQGLIVVNVKWIDGGPRYVYEDHLSQIGGWADLRVKTEVDETPVHVPWNGFVDNFTLGGDSLFFTGSENGTIPSIWEYDMKAKTTRCIVNGSAPWLEYAKITTALVGTVTNAFGNISTYYLWQPVQISVGKKYPVIIAKEFWNWSPYNQIAANEGCYFAIGDESCVEALYNALAKNPNVDTNCVYLYASSAGTKFVCDLISEKPDLWKGVILFGPIYLPDLSYLQNKRPLVIAGRNDPFVISGLTTTDRLKKYQDQAAKAGIPVFLSFLKDSGHMPNSDATERIRVRRFARFLSEN